MRITTPQRNKAQVGHYCLGGQAAIGVVNGYLLKPIANSAELAVQTINSVVNNVNVETERLNLILLSGIWGTGTLYGYRFAQGIMREWIDSVAGSYRFKCYCRPVVLSNAGAITNLDVEQTIGDQTWPQSGAGAWFEYATTPTPLVTRTGLFLTFNGMLGMRLRTTSWVVAGLGTSGHGVGNLNYAGSWQVIFNYELG